MRRIVVALATFAVLVPSALAWASAPTGNAKAIAFARVVAQRTNALPGVRIIQNGYVTMSSDRANSTVSWTFGAGAPGAGSYRAREAITIAQSHGSVVWLSDTLGPQGSCPPSTWCPLVQLLVTRHGSFAGMERSGAVACFHRISANQLPYRAGAAEWTVVGHYVGLVVHGARSIVTSTSTWSDGQRVTEIDVDATRSQIVRSATYQVAHGAYAYEPAFTFTEVLSALAHAPAAPKVSLCPA